MKRLRPREWVFVAFILLVALTCIRLGIWQLERLDQRRARNTEILLQQSLPDLQASQVTSDLDEMAFRRVTVSGTLYLDLAMALKNRTFDGQPGQHLLAPMEIADDLPLLMVDLGWVPVTFSTQEARYQTTQATVSGILLPSQPEPGWSLLADPTYSPEAPPLQAWRVLNVKRMEQELELKLLPFYLGVEDAVDLEMISPLPDTQLDLGDGPHLGYAIQWFSFSLIAVIGGGAWLRRRKK